MVPNKKLSVVIFGILFSVNLVAQDDLPLFELKDNIRGAFEQLKKNDTVSIDTELEQEVALNYFQGIRMFRPENYKDENKAKELIQYYYSPQGIFEILAEWKADTVFSDAFYFLSGKIDLELKKIKSGDTITMDESSKTRIRYLVARNEYNQKEVGKRREIISNPDQPKAIPNRELGNRKFRIREAERARVLTKDTLSAAKDPTKVITVDKKILGKHPPVLIPPNVGSNQMVLMSLFGSKNKYATLIIDGPDIPDASVFLDKKFIDTVGRVKNGILVRSKHLYDFEIQFNDSIFCQNRISLEPKERKTTGCCLPK